MDKALSSNSSRSGAKGLLESTLCCAVKDISPFSGYLEAPTFVNEFYKRWSKQYGKLGSEVSQLHRQMLRDLLIEIHPPVETKKVPKQRLVIKGLPSSAPDPYDFL